VPVTGPFFKWFGSKWLASKHYPAPRYNDIVEIYAGSAGYSLRHVDKTAWLYDANTHVRDLWSWLIGYATPEKVRAIPVDLPEGESILNIPGLDGGQRLLVKMWQRTNNVGDCWTVSPWGNKPGQWTESTRRRIAEELPAIKHWHFVDSPTVAPVRATHFIDPPYQYNYQYRCPPIPYRVLGDYAWSLASYGQVIVCEARCPKTGEAPDWLPFQDFAERITSRRKAGNHTHSKELVWYGTCEAPKKEEGEYATK
jgi:hypothetical protein